MDRAAELLDLLAAEARPLRLSDIALGLAMPKSSAHRLCAGLVNLNMVYRDDNGNFSLGPRLLTWGAAAERAYDIKAVAEESMRHLRDLTGETVNLHVRHGEYRVCIAAVNGLFALVPVMSPGRRLPLGLGATGRLLMAFAPPSDVARARSLLVDTGHHPPTDVELDLIRADHWVTVSGELEVGLTAASTSVRAGDGRVVAALSLGGASARLTPERLAELRGTVMHAAAELGEKLGDPLVRSGSGVL